MDATSDFQVEFLGKIQRILSDGQFTSTYKFALLIAIADIAVANKCTEAGTLDISTEQLAEKFISYYWRQSKEFIRQDQKFLLKQNSGAQAAIITKILKIQESSKSFGHAKKSAGWPSLVKQIGKIILDMPLWRLQNIGSGPDDDAECFIYENTQAGNHITLKKDVPYCLRSFHSLITDLVQSAWVRHIRKINLTKLGNTIELSEFLFGGSRNSLVKLVEPLMKLQNNNCFYCKGQIKRDPHVDHFIPWSRYQIDLGHNFVISHSTCNTSKSNHIASMDHLESWLSFTTSNKGPIAEIANEAHFPHDIAASHEIAQSIYCNAAKFDSRGWHQKNDFRTITGDIMIQFNRYETGNLSS